MTSKQYTEAYVWIWLPEATEPVVAGKLEADGKELPLQSGSIPLLDGLDMPSCIRDAAPDAWGRRVIINRNLGLKGANADTASQAMLIHESNNLSQLQNCLDTAHNFHLSQSEAVDIIEHQKRVIETQWDAVCDEAALSEIDKRLLWERQFLNPFIFEGLA